MTDGIANSSQEEQQKAIVQGELVISDEDLRKVHYFEPNVVGDLP